MSAKKRLQKKLLEKQQNTKEEEVATKHQRDTALMQYLQSDAIQEKTRDMKNKGIDPNTAYEQLVQEYNLNHNINQFLNEALIARVKRGADEMAKVQGELLQAKEEKEKVKRKTKKDKDRRKKKNRKMRKEEIEKMSEEDYHSAIINLLNKPIGRGSRSVFDGPNTRQTTGFLPEYKPNANEGGRKKRRRTKKRRRRRRKKTRKKRRRRKTRRR
jgi:hypothetical protein